MGHRVWSQKLDKTFSEDDELCCRRLHGHVYTAKIGLRSIYHLTRGMVTDFKHLNFVKTIIDKDWDHRFMIDASDPMLPNLFPEFENIDPKYIKDSGFYKNFDLSQSDFDKVTKERIEGFVVVDFVPTSENICECLFQIVQHKMRELLREEGIKLAFVELWETPKSHCRYEPNE